MFNQKIKKKKKKKSTYFPPRNIRTDNLIESDKRKHLKGEYI